MTDGLTSVRRMFEGYKTGKIDDAADYIHPGYFNPDALERTDTRGPDHFADCVAWLHNAFSELHFEELEVIDNGPVLFVRVVMSGRHTGDLVGFPPTGRAFYAEQLHLCRIVDGKVEYHRDWRDDLGVLRQLGFPKAA
ncbi:ester cyclase [Actinomadura gamaensis]|uniref:Ester cyclase n=1 Tax=Actinomadura gamaensis TaxID=1763541 RepID=A0ABV9U2P6_9ACTN